MKPNRRTHKPKPTSPGPPASEPVGPAHKKNHEAEPYPRPTQDGCPRSEQLNQTHMDSYENRTLLGVNLVIPRAVMNMWTHGDVSSDDVLLLSLIDLRSDVTWSHTRRRDVRGVVATDLDLFEDLCPLEDHPTLCQEKIRYLVLRLQNRGIIGTEEIPEYRYRLIWIEPDAIAKYEHK